MNDKAKKDGHIEGEGSYSGTESYNEATAKFLKKGKVDEAARDAKPISPAEADELRRAEDEGKSHAKGEDPLLNRRAKPAG